MKLPEPCANPTAKRRTDPVNSIIIPVVILCEKIPASLVSKEAVANAAIVFVVI
jgi:hypothetical protein